MKLTIVAAALSAALLCVAGTSADVQARVPAAVLAQAELSMLVKGKLDVAADGKVTAMRVEDESHYPAGIMNFVRNAVMAWEFEQVLRDGAAVPFTTPMNLRLVARQAAEGAFDVRIAHQSFRSYDQSDRRAVRSSSMAPPRYPEGAWRSGMTGTVYLALQVGQDGKVMEVAARQVDLTRGGREREMQRAREILATASIQAARNWQFSAPEEGPAHADGSWVVTVPVTFSLAYSSSPSQTPAAAQGVGRWQPYIPGPRLFVPFLQEGQDDFNTAMAAGEVYMSGQQGAKLKTPLGG